jgi:outer membrane protein, multidrug efflux system
VKNQPSIHVAGLLSLALALPTSGCAVGPDYTRPDVKTPPDHRGQKVKTETSLAELPWWRVFRDPVLSRYLLESLTNAYDVRMAAARIEQSRAQARAAMWAFWPTFGAQVGLGGGQGMPGVPTTLPPAALNGNFGASASVSWELDVWGRLRRQKEAADAYARAADEDQRAVYVALVGDVASSYIDMRKGDEQIVVLDAAIKTRQATADYFMERAKGGVGNDVEYARANANVADAKAQMGSYRQLVWNAENRLSFLIARPPGALERGASLSDFTMPPEIPAGLPSTLLARRPDLRVAEEQLHAATAVVGIRIGDVLPKFALTGSAGVASDVLTNSNAETAGIYSGFAGLTIPIPVLGGATKLNEIDMARARVNELVALYQKIFFNALREVSDALGAVEHLAEVRAQREEQVKHLMRTEQLADERYRGGVASYIEVITAQERSLLAQLELAEAKALQHQAVISLYRALGGGWSMKEPEAAQQPQPQP